MNYIEMAKQRIFEHLAAASAIPYKDEWEFAPLVKLMPEHIIDPLGEKLPIDRPSVVNATWSYPTNGQPGARPTRAMRAVPADQVLVGWGRVYNTNNGSINVRVLLAAVTTSPQTTGVVTIPVGPDGPFPPRDPVTREFVVDPAVVLFLKQGLTDNLAKQANVIAVNQQVQGVSLVADEQEQTG